MVCLWKLVGKCDVTDIYEQEYVILCEMCAYLSFYKSKGRATVFLLYLFNHLLMDFASFDVGLKSLNIYFSTLRYHMGVL